MRMDVVCPTCKKTFSAEFGGEGQTGGKDGPKPDPALPFCTERCRVLDLGQWCDEAFRISHPLVPPEYMPAELGLDEESRFA